MKNKGGVFDDGLGRRKTKYKGPKAQQLIIKTNKPKDFLRGFQNMRLCF